MIHRGLAFSLWIALLAGALYFYFFQRGALEHVLAGLAGAPRMWAYAVYLALGCIRGFTLVPATYLVVAGMLILPPVPLYVLTIAGIVVSSAAVYYFADAMRSRSAVRATISCSAGPPAGLDRPAPAPDRDSVELFPHRADRPGLLRVRRPEGRPHKDPPWRCHR